VVSGGADKKMFVVDWRNNKVLTEFKSHTDWIYGILFSQNEKFVLSADSNNNVFVWEKASGKELWKF
jgi:WD40 repeat protein